MGEGRAQPHAPPSEAEAAALRPRTILELTRIAFEADDAARSEPTGDAEQGSGNGVAMAQVRSGRQTLHWHLKRS